MGRCLGSLLTQRPAGLVFPPVGVVLGRCRRGRTVVVRGMAGLFRMMRGRVLGCSLPAETGAWRCFCRCLV